MRPRPRVVCREGPPPPRVTTWALMSPTDVGRDEPEPAGDPGPSREEAGTPPPVRRARPRRDGRGRATSRRPRVTSLARAGRKRRWACTWVGRGPTHGAVRGAGCARAGAGGAGRQPAPGRLHRGQVRGLRCAGSGRPGCGRASGPGLPGPPAPPALRPCCGDTGQSRYCLPTLRRRLRPAACPGPGPPLGRSAAPWVGLGGREGGRGRAGPGGRRRPGRGQSLRISESCFLVWVKERFSVPGR